MPEIANVVSVCTLKDIHTWAYAAPRIISNIDAENFHLIIPARYSFAFGLVTPDRVKVHHEESFAPEISFEFVRNRIPPQNQWRVGWYYQQLLKLAAALKLGESDEDINLIWDADTIPLSPLKFSHQGKLIYHTGTEYHLPYFEAIKRLLDLPKVTNFSFIAQCFPVKKSWVREFKENIERAHQENWNEAILSCSDQSNASGFSEYETLGTYAAHRHQDEMLISNAKWERFGAKICQIEKLAEYVTSAQDQLAYLSYETWDPNQSRNLDLEENSDGSRLLEHAKHQSWLLIESAAIKNLAIENTKIYQLIRELPSTNWIEFGVSTQNTQPTEKNSAESNAFKLGSKKSGNTPEGNLNQESNDRASEKNIILNLRSSNMSHRDVAVSKTRGWVNSLQGLLGFLVESNAQNQNKKCDVKTYVKLGNPYETQSAELLFSTINWTTSPEIIELSSPDNQIEMFLQAMKYQKQVFPDGDCIYVKRGSFVASN